MIGKGGEYDLYYGYDDPEAALRRPYEEGLNDSSSWVALQAARGLSQIRNPEMLEEIANFLFLWR